MHITPNQLTPVAAVEHSGEAASQHRPDIAKEELRTALQKVIVQDDKGNCIVEDGWICGWFRAHKVLLELIDRGLFDKKAEGVLDRTILDRELHLRIDPNWRNDNAGGWRNGLSAAFSSLRAQIKHGCYDS